jgi:drug/metabolite transporter (DMT)-like permease
LPLAAVGYLAFWLFSAVTGSAFAMPFGPRPAFFIGLMFAIGLFASWLGTICWNEASQRLSTTLVGQLIVFETIAALIYAFVLRGEFPQSLTLTGIAFLIGGVLSAVRIKPEPIRITYQD